MLKWKSQFISVYKLYFPCQQLQQKTFRQFYISFSYIMLHNITRKLLRTITHTILSGFSWYITRSFAGRLTDIEVEIRVDFEFQPNFKRSLSHKCVWEMNKTVSLFPELWVK